MSEELKDLQELLEDTKEDVQNLYAGMKYTSDYIVDIGKMAVFLQDTEAALPLIEEFKQSVEKYRQMRQAFGAMYRTLQGREDI